MTEQNPPPVYIGIDPAFRKAGFAICIIDHTREVSLRTFASFLDFLRWLDSEDAPEEAFVVIENSNLDNKTYWTHRSPTGALLTKAQARRISGSKVLSPEELAKISRNVGCNQAVSQCTVDACRKKWGDQARGISPKDKGAKWPLIVALGVMRQHRHTLIHEGRISQDEVDAYQLAERALLIFSKKPSYKPI